MVALLPLAVLLGLALLVGDRTRPAPERPLPDTRPRAVVTMGDSTVAGEGAGEYAPGTRGEDGNSCHRSARALVHRIELPGVTKRINLGCSGARAADVGFARPELAEGTNQAARLGQVARRYRIQAVVVAVGANDDPRFAGTMLHCIEAWARRSGPPCSASLAGQWPQRLDAMAPKVERALSDVRRGMRAAGYPKGDYSLVLQSYASPLTEKIDPVLQDLSGCPFRTEDLAWVRTVAVPQLSAALRGVAERVGTRFLDLARATEGHEACSSATFPTQEWITRLTVDFELLRERDSGSRAVAESFHPNATGHARIAGCLSEFLQVGDREAACVAGPGGILHPVVSAVTPPG